MGGARLSRDEPAASSMPDVKHFEMLPRRCAPGCGSPSGIGPHCQCS